LVRKLINHLKLIIFDVDGVLRDSGSAGLEGMRRGFKSLGLEFTFTKDECRLIRNTGSYNDSKKCIALMYAVLKLKIKLSDLVKKEIEKEFDKVVSSLTEKDLETVEKIRKVYKEFFYSEEAGDFVEFFPDTKSALDKMGKRFKLAIWTNASAENVKRDLSSLNLKRFSYILGGEDTGMKKPSGDGILLICKELGVKPTESIYVGDAVVDIRAAKEAGCISVAICRSKLLEVFLKNEKPDFIFKNLSEIAEKFC